MNDKESINGEAPKPLGSRIFELSADLESLGVLTKMARQQMSNDMEATALDVVVKDIERLSGIACAYAYEAGWPMCTEPELNLVLKGEPSTGDQADDCDPEASGNRVSLPLADQLCWRIRTVEFDDGSTMSLSDSSHLDVDTVRQAAERLASEMKLAYAADAPAGVPIGTASESNPNHRVVSVHDDPDAELEFVPPARQSVTYKELGITEVHGSTRWGLGKDSPRTIDDLRFTAREERDDDMPASLVWWRVTPADTDYWHVHQLHGRSLAFEFLDLVNLPDGDDDRVSGTALGCIAKGMAEAGRRDWRQETIAGGFWNAIGEYLIDGTCDR